MMLKALEGRCHYCGHDHSEDHLSFKANQELRAENERLQRELEDARHQCKVANQEHYNMEQEIERLKAELAEYKAAYEKKLADNRFYNEANHKLAEELAALKAELSDHQNQAETDAQIIKSDGKEIRILREELAEARKNDRIAMSYLSEIRTALGFDGDFPALVKHCAALKQASEPTPEMLEAVWQHRKRNDGVEDTYESVIKRDFAVDYKVAMRAAPQPKASEPVAELFLGTHGIEVMKDYGVMNFGESFDVYRTPQPQAQDALDAARYRWLRDQRIDDGIVVVMKNKHIKDNASYAENIDSYIDAAMGETK